MLLVFIKENTAVIDANPAELLKLILLLVISSVSARMFAENGINRNLFGNRRRLAVYSREIQFYGLKIEKNFSKKHDL